MRAGALPAVLMSAAMLALAACAARSPTIAPDRRPAAFAQLPDWSGIWSAQGLDAGIDGFPDPSPNAQFPPYALVGLDAPWNENGRKLFQGMLAGMAGRKSDGWGYPMMMHSPALLQFVLTPAETLVINPYRDLRHVYTDGRGHPPEADRWATTWGHSVGKWEGDTLVIDTVSVRDPTTYFLFAPPLTEQAHYVERLRMTGPGRIESEVTIHDPQTLSKPWVAKIVYEKVDGLDELTHDAFTNDRSEVEEGVFSIEPPKD